MKRIYFDHSSSTPVDIRALNSIAKRHQINMIIDRISKKTKGGM